MRINEVILEEQQLDELSLSGVGRAIGRGAGTTAQAAGAIAGGAAGAWDRMKQGYRAGKAYVSDPQGGSTSPASGTAPTSSQQATTSTPGAPQTTSSSVPQQTAQQGQAPAGQAAASAAPTGQLATAAPNAAPAAGGAMKAAEIVKDLDDAWQKATADQGSETTSPAVQNQIRAMAKQAGLAGQTIKENKVGYQSKFLDMII